MNIIREFKTTKRDIINIKCASEKVENIIGEELEIEKAMIYEDNIVNTESGEVELSTLCALITTEGTIVSSPSKTLVEFTDLLIDLLEDENSTIKIKLVTRKSNNGRNFYTGQLI